MKSGHWMFFLYTFLWSWGLWIIPVLFGIHSIVPLLFFALGGVAPSSTGIILAFLKRDKEYWKDFLHRIINYRQIRFLWYIIIILLVPVTTILAILVHYFLTGTIPELTKFHYFIANPLQIIPFAIFMLLFGPIIEEIGWRGYALDHLEKRYSWFKSSIILGVFWALWHLPLFFIEGTYQYNLINDSYLYFIDFIIVFFPMSVIMDWIYHNNGRSILSGILFHFSINFYGELIDLPNDIKIYRTIGTFLIAIAILMFWRKQKSSDTFT